MKPPLKTYQPDDYQTPPEALDPLIPVLKENGFKLIWEPACGKGLLVDRMRQEGFYVCPSDINPDLGGNYLHKDFLIGDNELVYQCIVTNPPFSFKQQFLEHCYRLGKPFALLLPLTTFETPKRQGLFAKHGVQVIFLDQRINFLRDGAKSGSWFASAWYSWGMNLPKDLNFFSFKKGWL